VIESTVDLEALRVQTEERLSQSKRVRDRTQDTRVWADYCRACRYFEDVLSLIASRDAQRAEIADLKERLGYPEFAR
jgi:hypothetical protein